MLTSKCFYAHIFCHIADAWYQLAIPALLPTYMVMSLNYNVLEVSAVTGKFVNVYYSIYVRYILIQLR